MEKTMTRVEMMNEIKAMVEASASENKDTILEFCDKQIASFSKKSESKADKERKAENEIMQNQILEVLADGSKMRVSEILKSVNDAMETDFSWQISTKEYLKLYKELTTCDKILVWNTKIYWN